MTEMRLNKMDKINIAKNSNCELCLRVSNIEELWNCRKLFHHLMIKINSMYLYNNEQLTELISGLNKNK